MNTNKYNKLANDFCLNTGTEITVRLSKEQKKPNWGTPVDNRHLHYIVEIKNKKGGFSFDYWGSINDYEKVYKYKDINYIKHLEAQKEVSPKPYDILACLTVFYGNFEDFCDEFGYNTDSIQAQQTYFEVRRQTGSLLDMFTNDELNTLQDII